MRPRTKQNEEFHRRQFWNDLLCDAIAVVFWTFIAWFGLAYLDLWGQFWRAMAEVA